MKTKTFLELLDNVLFWRHVYASDLTGKQGQFVAVTFADLPESVSKLAELAGSLGFDEGWEVGEGENGDAQKFRKNLHHSFLAALRKTHFGTSHGGRTVVIFERLEVTSATLKQMKKMAEKGEN